MSTTSTIKIESEIYPRCSECGWYVIYYEYHYLHGWGVNVCSKCGLLVPVEDVRK
jgi:hypothetical protein